MNEPRPDGTPTASLPHRDAATAPSRLAGGWPALRHRDFRIFAAGQVVSLIGTWMQQVAQAWLVLELTGDPFMLGVVTAAQLLPVAIAAPFGGVLADRLPKRSTLILTQAVAMTLAFLLFGLTIAGWVAVWHIIVLAVLLGLSNAVEYPTRQAYAVELVDRSEMTSAIALNAAAFHGARIVGPSLAGITIAAAGVAMAFLINGLSFIAVIGSFLMIRSMGQGGSRGRIRLPAIVAELGEGLRFARETPDVRLPLVVVGATAVVAMNFQVLVPVLATVELEAGPEAFGFLMTALGAGSLTAALVVASRRDADPRLVGIGGVLLGASCVVLGISRWLPLSAIALFTAGVGAIGMAVTANAVIQAAVPDRLRGRVTSLYVALMSASIPIGGLATGAIASIAGASIAMAAGGALAVMIGMVAIVRGGRIRRRS